MPVNETNYTGRKGTTMRTVQLAPRANALVYTEAQVIETIDALGSTHYPQAVIFDETPCDTKNAAAGRAGNMRALIIARDPNLPKPRAHAAEEGDKFYAALTMPRPKRTPKPKKADENGGTPAASTTPKTTPKK